MVTQTFGKQIFMAFRNVNRSRKECIHVNQLIADTHVDTLDSDRTLTVLKETIYNEVHDREKTFRKKQI